MVPELISHSPFAQLSLIAAPAILTNACSLLATSTSNRFLRASERLRIIANELEKPATSEAAVELYIRQVSRLERQSVLLLSALHGAYVSLGSFALASLVSILGAAISEIRVAPFWSYPFVTIALVAGFTGAGSLVWACVSLSRATRLSVMNISEEAELIRAREAQKGRRPALSAVG